MRAKSKKTTPAKDKKIEEFISGAKYSELNEESFSFPWENPDMDTKKTRKMTIRIPEEYALKLDFLIEKSTPKTTKQRLILENLIQLIDSEIKKKT